MDKANPDPDLPHFSVSKDDDNDNDNDDDNGEGDNDEDDNGDVNGPTVQAHVDLAKTACKYCRTQYCWNILTYIYSTQSLPWRHHWNRA